jgi:hypothetical protein
MRLRELFTEAAAPKQLGRAFNHLEDLVFFYGTEGAEEALAHIKDMAQGDAAAQSGSSSLRMKWDGNPQIYWGRENGQFVPPHGHNQWSKGQAPSSAEDVGSFIMSTGKAATPEEVAQRQKFADKFTSLAPVFAPATPKDLDSNRTYYVYADALFLERPQLDNQGVYTFCPNPKSETCYHVRGDSELGKRIAQADVMVVGHAYFTEHGQPDSAQIPIKDFSMFNANPKLIVLGPIYNPAPVSVDTRLIDKVAADLAKYGDNIQNFINALPAPDKEGIFYRYLNQTAKAKKLDLVSSEHFLNWINDPVNKVSKPKALNIANLEQKFNALEAMWTIVKDIQAAKDQVIDQVESGPKADIWDTKGEGRVRYADQNKKFGNVKFVPRKRWTPT